MKPFREFRWLEFPLGDPEEPFHPASIQDNPSHNYARVLQVWIDAPLGGYWADIPIERTQ